MNEALSTEIVEIVMFRTKPGRASEVPALAAKALDEARRHVRVLDDVLRQACDDENVFVHEVRWASLEDAKRAAALFPTFACAAAFAEITQEHLGMAHFPASAASAASAARARP